MKKRDPTLYSISIRTLPGSPRGIHPAFFKLARLIARTDAAEEFKRDIDGRISRDVGEGEKEK